MPVKSGASTEQILTSSFVYGANPIQRERISPTDAVPSSPRYRLVLFSKVGSISILPEQGRTLSSVLPVTTVLAITKLNTWGNLESTLVNAILSSSLIDARLLGSVRKTS